MNQPVAVPLVLVAVGSAAGGVCRYGVARWLGPTAFPWGTLAVNLVGSFLIGVFAVVLLGHVSDRVQDLYLLFGTGFCGGLTTFSTFEWELLRLIRERAYVAAAVYVSASVSLGLLAVVAGAACAARWK